MKIGSVFTNVYKEIIAMECDPKVGEQIKKDLKQTISRVTGEVLTTPELKKLT